MLKRKQREGKKVYNTYSHAVSHPITNPGKQGSTSEIGQELVLFSVLPLCKPYILIYLDISFFFLLEYISDFKFFTFRQL